MSKRMNVLIACEESQRVCIEFRKLGHRAFSCDIMECSGGHPEWHMHGDVLPLIKPEDGGYPGWYFCTMDGKTHYVEKWDMIIAFPPCTHLAVSGARHFEKKRADGRQKDGIKFFCEILNADCEKIAVENPVNIISGQYVVDHFPVLSEKYGLPIHPAQYVQPYEFGHEARKKTGLWLKGLPALKPTKIVDPGEIVGKGFSVGASLDMARDENGKIISWNDPRTGIIRSKTFPGIAKAMAEQWGGQVDE